MKVGDFVLCIGGPDKGMVDHVWQIEGFENNLIVITITDEYHRHKKMKLYRSNFKEITQ